MRGLEPMIATDERHYLIRLTTAGRKLLTVTENPVFLSRNCNHKTLEVELNGKAKLSGFNGILVCYTVPQANGFSLFAFTKTTHRPVISQYKFHINYT